MIWAQKSWWFGDSRGGLVPPFLQELCRGALNLYPVKILSYHLHCKSARGDLDSYFCDKIAVRNAYKEVHHSSLILCLCLPSSNPRLGKGMCICGLILPHHHLYPGSPCWCEWLLGGQRVFGVLLLVRTLFWALVRFLYARRCLQSHLRRIHHCRNLQLKLPNAYTIIGGQGAPFFSGWEPPKILYGGWQLMI